MIFSKYSYFKGKMSKYGIAEEYFSFDFATDIANPENNLLRFGIYLFCTKI